MIGATISYTLDGAEPAEVTVRPADLFAAEDQLGFDPLERFSDAAAVERPSTGAMRALVVVTWAAHQRTAGDGMELADFIRTLTAMPTAAVAADALRPIRAAASGE